MTRIVARTRPPGVAVDEIGCFNEVTLRGLLFDTESSAVSAEDGSRIDQALAQYKSLPDDIEAQTRIDDRGPHRQHGYGGLQPGPVRAARKRREGVGGVAGRQPRADHDGWQG